MRRWAPWLLAFIVWNGTFDLQVRRAGEAFTARQVEAWRRQAPLPLVRDAFTPRVRDAAWRSTALAAALLALGLAAARRARRGPSVVG